MSNGLELFNQILFLNLRPWMQGQVAEQKYLQLLQEVQKQNYQFQPLYKVDFPNPLNAKRKYYASLVANEAIKFLNATYTVIENANQRGKKYWLNEILNRKVKPKLKEVQKLIEEHSYTLDAIHTPTNITGYEDLRDNSFIIQFLKLHLIHIYLEFQNKYAHLLNEEPVIEIEIRQHFFSEKDIEKPSLIKADEVPNSKQTVQPKVQTVVKSLPAIKADFREDKKGILSYAVIIKNPDKFAKFEEELFGHELIDMKHNFTNKHGQLKELAAVYHTLVRKGYFNKKDFSKNKAITPLDVRKFLDHRYAASLDKQFRIWANDQDELTTFIDDQFWLTRLQPC